MLSKTLQVFITSIAFAPVLLVLWIINIIPALSAYQFTTVTVNLKGMAQAAQIFWKLTGWYFFIFALLVVVSWWLLRVIRNTLTVRMLEIKSIKSSDFNLNTPLMSYFLPILKLKVLELNSAFFWGSLVIFFLFALNNRRTYNFNPVLAFFGFRHYEIATKKEVSYILITRQKLINADQCKHYIAITDYLVMDAE